MKPVRYAVAFWAFGVLTGCFVLTLDRIFAPDARVWALLVTFAPYALVGYLVAGIALALTMRNLGPRLRRLSLVGIALALVGALLHGVWIAPAFVGSHASGEPDVTVLSLNMRYGGADPALTARLVREVDPDVVVLLEATPYAMSALAANGVGGGTGTWRFSGGVPLDGILGTVVLSAHPLTNQVMLDVPTGAYRMTVEGRQPFTLIALHTSQPLSRHASWLRDFATLRGVVPHLQDRPLVLAGDFNATMDHGPMRSLLDGGLHDAAWQANSGWQMTWPAPGVSRVVRWPVIAIDHVLVNGRLSAVSTQTHAVPGTDHLALEAELAFR